MRRPLLEQIVPYQRMITLTTDFGVTEHYVGAMKGVIHNINPSVQMVDITNAVPIVRHSGRRHRHFPGLQLFSQCTSIWWWLILAWELAQADPREYWRTFVRCADNGVLSWCTNGKSAFWFATLHQNHYFRQPISNTFHGRDIFAPVAAWLSKGVDTDKFGDEITDFVRFLRPNQKQWRPTPGRA